MIRKRNGALMILFVLASMLWSVLDAFGAGSVTVLDNAAKPAPVDCRAIPDITLSTPPGDGDQRYLGLSGTGDFKIGQIRTQILLIEIFSFYCPHCQRTASQVNDLFNEIQRRSDLNGRIKMIGIGAKNSAFEVDSYRERYRVPFPLFPDRELEMTEKLCTKGTPTFIGFKMDGKGSQDRFYFAEGGFQDVQKFLAEIIERSGLK
jgi:hypothetical protein